jgi:hypothetical protein
MEKGADISADGFYRYSLWRIWEPHQPLVMFIGLNLPLMPQPMTIPLGAVFGSRLIGAMAA